MLKVTTLNSTYYLDGDPLKVVKIETDNWRQIHTDILNWNTPVTQPEVGACFYGNGWHSSTVKKVEVV